MEQKHIPLPFVFLKYFITDEEEIAVLEKSGMKNTRVINNNGSVIIQSEDIPICHVLPRARRKRNDPYDSPDEQRDTIAEHIVRCVNSHDDLVAALENILKMYESDAGCRELQQYKNALKALEKAKGEQP